MGKHVFFPMRKIPSSVPGPSNSKPSLLLPKKLARVREDISSLPRRPATNQNRQYLEVSAAGLCQSEQATLNSVERGSAYQSKWYWIQQSRGPTSTISPVYEVGGRGRGQKAQELHNNCATSFVRTTQQNKIPVYCWTTLFSHIHQTGQKKNKN